MVILVVVAESAGGAPAQRPSPAFAESSDTHHSQGLAADIDMGMAPPDRNASVPHGPQRRGGFGPRHGHYIAVFQKTATNATRAAHMAKHRALASTDPHSEIHHTFKLGGFEGYTGRFSATLLASALADGAVEIELDMEVRQLHIFRPFLTAFDRFSRVLSATPPHTRRVLCSNEHPCLSDAD